MRNNIDVNVRFYQPGDEVQIVELLRKTFPKWASFNDPVGLWRWKYIDTPLRSVITLAVASEKIVGCNHVLVYNAKLGSELSTIVYGDDLAVDTDFRGLGIWTRMRDLYLQEYSKIGRYTCSTTVNPIVQKSWVKRNISLLPFTVTRMMKTKNIDQLLTERKMENKTQLKLGYIGLSYLNQITNIFRPTIKQADEFQITRSPKFDDRIDIFWDRIKDDYNFILEKKHDYLNWRFTDNDRGSHVFFQAVNGEEVLGYAVVEYVPGGSEGRIVDLLALGDRLDVAGGLMGRACECLNGLGLNTVYYQVVLGHPYQDLSKRKGFIDSRSRPYISFDYTTYYRERDYKIQFLKNTAPSQVHFNYADTV